jgi:DNA-binding FadR family transcriptional regulator
MNKIPEERTESMSQLAETMGITRNTLRRFIKKKYPQVPISMGKPTMLTKSEAISITSDMDITKRNRMEQTGGTLRSSTKKTNRYTAFRSIGRNRAKFHP